MTAALLHRRLLCALLVAGALPARAQASGQLVDIYTSADFAPLLLADGRGLYPDLVALLNRQRPGGLHFKLHYLPRKRLQVRLEADDIDGIVIGMMPEWLGDTARARYLWSEPFSSDGYSLVSLAARPMRPSAPAAMVGASVGVTADYVYPGIDAWLRTTRMVRSDGPSDEKNLEKLLQGRVDCIIVASSMVRYFIRSQKMGDRLHVVALPGAVTERRFLAPQRQRAVFDKVAPLIKKLRDDPAWRSTVAAYE